MLICRSVEGVHGQRKLVTPVLENKTSEKV